MAKFKFHKTIFHQKEKETFYYNRCFVIRLYHEALLPSLDVEPNHKSFCLL